jgi:hypothetical protein
MPTQNILVAVIDGLRASALGAYGNTSYPTPFLDRLAADSFLFDWCFAPSEDLATIYRSLWDRGPESLLAQFRAAGYRATLITDDPLLVTFSGASDFDHCVQVGDDASHTGVDANRASDISETDLAELFVTAAEQIVAADSSKPQIVWLHSRGMYGPWDAPLELQIGLLDENDPPPVEAVTLPNLTLSASDDPDVAFRFATAYAAQAMVLDECWETIQDALANSATGPDWLVTLLGARGFPLGEHRQVGGVDPRLYAEQLHVPWLVHDPQGAGRLGRSGALVTHNDLAQMLLASSLRDKHEPTSVAALAEFRASLRAESLAGYRALRTAEWCLRQDPVSVDSDSTSTSGQMSRNATELFVRPDDRWEANNVAKLCEDVVETLTNQLNTPTPSEQHG